MGGLKQGGYQVLGEEEGLAMFKVVDDAGAVFGLVDTSKEAEQVIRMKKEVGKGGGPVKPDKSNLTNAGRLNLRIVEV